jgi:hypothetical protein
MRWTEQVACIEENRNAYRILVRKPKVKRPLVHGRKHVKMIPKEMASKGKDGIHMAQEMHQW